MAQHTLVRHCVGTGARGPIAGILSLAAPGWACVVVAACSGGVIQPLQNVTQGFGGMGRPGTGGFGRPA